MTLSVVGLPVNTKYDYGLSLARRLHSVLSLFGLYVMFVVFFVSFCCRFECFVLRIEEGAMKPKCIEVSKIKVK